MDYFNILFTSVGRRVALIRGFKSAYNDLEIRGSVFTADVKDNVSARYFADDHIVVPSITHPDYIKLLLEICRNYHVDLLIPLIDPELLILSKEIELFDKIGTNVLISSRETIDICNYKDQFEKFLRKNDFDVPMSYAEEKLVFDSFRKKEFFIKPNYGSCSKDTYKLSTYAEYEFFKNHIQNPIVQEFISGDEFTIDVLVDLSGKAVSAVPRLRIETRSGEVSKALTVRDNTIISESKALVETLPGVLGCITVQCIKTDDHRIKFIEINPRFGGGIPLSIKAGADFPRWIIEMFIGIDNTIDFENWQDGLLMLRYDEAIFVNENEI